MTEPSEAAMKVWREAFTRYNATAAITMADPNKAAALVIDRAMVAGEPVAFMYERDTLSPNYLSHHRLPAKHRSAYRTETPLYTHPAPTAATDVAELVEALSGVVHEAEWMIDAVALNPQSRGGVKDRLKKARALLARLGRVEG